MFFRGEITMKKRVRNGNIVLDFFRLPRKHDFLLTFCCLILSVIGIVYIASASITSSTDVVKNVIVGATKQTIFLAGGYVLMCFLANRYNYEFNMKHITWFRRIMVVFGGIVLAGLVLCLFFPDINGTNAWIQLEIPLFSTVTVQPSEFAKVVLILLIAAFMCGTKEKNTWLEISKTPWIFLILYLVIILELQNDFGSGLMMFVVFFGCYIIPVHRGFNKVKIFMILAMLAGIFLLSFLLSPSGLALLEKLPFLSEYQVNRFKVSVDPFSDMYGNGFQVSNSLIAFARGGLFGQGLGASVQKFGYLPFATSDFIIAVIAEEGGLFMLSIVFILYGIIIWRLISYALKVNRIANKVVLVGSAVYLFVHFVFNVGGATAFLPLTGVPLLMLSSGGSSLLAWYICVGLSQSIIDKYRKGMGA